MNNKVKLNFARRGSGHYNVTKGVKKCNGKEIGTNKTELILVLLRPFVLFFF